MDGESFEKIIKHIKYYNEAKKNKDFAKFHINKNSGANFCIAQTKDEVLFIFLSSKKTFKFIREYEQYKRNLKQQMIYFLIMKIKYKHSFYQRNQLN